ncbi:MAG: anti-sigma sporulation factor, LonB [Lacunisphaera sp.]|nr:anti-sigma sporulation factor, LonB [Lacunisphaera sp.]
MSPETMLPDPPLLQHALPNGRIPRIPATLAILPVRKIVLFPGLVVTLTVDDAGSRQLLEESLPQERVIGIFTRKAESTDQAGLRGLCRVGVAASVLKLSRGDDGALKATVSVIVRIAPRKEISASPFLRSQIEVLEPVGPEKNDHTWQALVQELREHALQYVKATPDLPPSTAGLVQSLEEPGQLADLVAASLPIASPQKQDLLETLDVPRRVRAVLVLVSDQLEIARLRQKIDRDVAAHFTAAQRRSYLREQVRTIQKELGEDGTELQAAELRARLQAAQPPEAVMLQADRELRRLARLPASSSESSLVVTYVELLAELPWAKATEDNLDLARARQILDRDHYDLDKVKRRLIEYLAVCKLNASRPGPVLCLAGPPGVGKTSLGQSIADALGRKFARISLGGVNDEAEIRGHRRTYVGAMPGRVMQELRRAGVRNPVMMLDEIDKLANDFTGDPASALLEVLDPRQNTAFLDRYLDVPFDLSQVIFIATANYMDDVPPALRDRLEVIRIPGYTDGEKLEIAQRYLVPRQLSENGLKPGQARFEPAALSRLVDDYTREAGVRTLERQIGAICRYLAALVAEDKPYDPIVTRGAIEPILGPVRFIRETRLTVAKPGIVTGLAWTPVGGEIMHIEALRYPGKGGILLTGQLGNVMRESAQAALSLIRSRADSLKIKQEDLRDYDIHIHLPAGGIPKDGPSAGVGMVTAIASLFCNQNVRPDIAMTGEITLRGLILPIGGLKEKLLAAHRAGIPNIIIPKLNEKDLVDVPAEIKSKLNLILVGTVDEVLAAALEKPAPRVSLKKRPALARKPRARRSRRGKR